MRSFQRSLSKSTHSQFAKSTPVWVESFRQRTLSKFTIFERLPLSACVANGSRLSQTLSRWVLIKKLAEITSINPHFYIAGLGPSDSIITLAVVISKSFTGLQNTSPLCKIPIPLLFKNIIFSARFKIFISHFIFAIWFFSIRPRRTRSKIG